MLLEQKATAASVWAPHTDFGMIVQLIRDLFARFIATFTSKRTKDEREIQK
jgi:hypothetical protein